MKNFKTLESTLVSARDRFKQTLGKCPMHKKGDPQVEAHKMKVHAMSHFWEWTRGENLSAFRERLDKDVLAEMFEDERYEEATEFFSSLVHEHLGRAFFLWYEEINENSPSELIEFKQQVESGRGPSIMAGVISLGALQSIKILGSLLNVGEINSFDDLYSRKNAAIDFALIMARNKAEVGDIVTRGSLQGFDPERFEKKEDTTWDIAPWCKQLIEESLHSIQAHMKVESGKTYFGCPFLLSFGNGPEGANEPYFRQLLEHYLGVFLEGYKKSLT